MFDEQPDGDIHGECAAEINRLMAKNAAIEAENEALQKRVAELEEAVLRELTAESQRLGLYDMEKSC